jgi:hypothetical protein
VTGTRARAIESGETDEPTQCSGSSPSQDGQAPLGVRADIGRAAPVPGPIGPHTQQTRPDSHPSSRWLESRSGSIVGLSSEQGAQQY